VADIDEILFRRSSPAQLTMTPSDESYEEWSYEVHLVETVSFVNRGGMLLVDVVPQNIRDHPYDACLSIVKRDEGKQIGNMVRTLGQVTVDGTLPTVRTELERFVEVVAVVVFRWHFDGSKESEKLTLEIIELDK
jgi:hypothetical protein